MKKCFLVFFMAAFMISCGNKSSQTSTDGTDSDNGISTSVNSGKKSDSNVLNRAKQIYDDVFAEYNKADDDTETVEQNNDEDKYCSKEWKELVAKVIDFDENNNPDEVGFFDADYWIMGQDFENLSASDFQLIEEKGDHAVVEFALHNFNDITRVRLEMVREDGNWFIDNFIDLNNAINWKEDMKDYLK